MSAGQVAQQLATPTTREARVQECMEIGSERRWERGKTSKQLAKKWGVSVRVAEDIAAEAWRRLRALQTDSDRRFLKVADVLEDVIDEALEETREPAMIDGGENRGVYQESPNGARRVVVEAAKLLATLTAPAGVFPANWESLSPEERWAAVDRAQAKVDAIRATLPPREVAQLPESEGEE